VPRKPCGLTQAHGSPPPGCRPVSQGRPQVLWPEPSRSDDAVTRTDRSLFPLFESPSLRSGGALPWKSELGSAERQQKRDRGEPVPWSVMLEPATSR
jgi:hypothetical protein